MIPVPPDRGTVNLAADSVNALYKMPNNNFLGFDTDRAMTNNLTYALCFDRSLSDLFSVRIAFFGLYIRYRQYRSQHFNTKECSQNRCLQFTQPFADSFYLCRRQQCFANWLDWSWCIYRKNKYTFQTGSDYRTNHTETVAYGSVLVDTIDVLLPINNVIPSRIVSLAAGDADIADSYSYGLMAQDVITFNKYKKQR